MCFLGDLCGLNLYYIAAMNKPQEEITPIQILQHAMQTIAGNRLYFPADYRKFEIKR